MVTVRRAAVAGTFYPRDPIELRRQVEDYLAQASGSAASAPPKALIVPHAGYIYSGPVAASAYACLRSGGSKAVERVVIIGPAHRVALIGLAASSVDVFSTPLGTVPVDHEALESVLPLEQVGLLDEAHKLEHSVEVQLPFLQCVFGNFLLLPLVVGQATAEQVAEVIERLWGGRETLLVVSSDLSHYYDYDTARRLDAATSQAIEALAPDRLGAESACGRVAIRGLLVAARRRGLDGKTIDLRNSGDTAGPRDEVVGYGAYVFTQAQSH